MIPVKIEESSPMWQHFQEDTKNEQQWVNLDLVQEIRDQARIHEQVAKKKGARKYNKKG